MRRLAVSVLVVGLLAASVAAFARTEALKLERSPIGATVFDRRFSPVCACTQERAVLRVRVRRADRVDATVVDGNGDDVRVLARDLEHEAGRVRLVWDGRDEAGLIVPDGRYRLKIHLDRDRRTIVIPKTITVDTVRPEIRITGVDESTISPDGDGRLDRVRVEYRLSEPAAVELLVDGETVRSRPLQYTARGRVAWRGLLGGGPAPQGFHSLALRAVDRAGNVSEVRTVVGVRYIQLDARSYEAFVGGVLRFSVSTDAEGFGWALTRRGSGRLVASGRSSEPDVSVTIPRGRRLAGTRLVLRATALGHSDRALVTVRRP